MDFIDLTVAKRFWWLSLFLLPVIFWLLWPKSKRKRLSDSRRVGRHDKQKLRQAEKLASKDPVQAARLLESIRFYREAIQILEEGGKIREAAQILYRMGRPNRAGILLRRHQYWKNASQAFEKASMPREAAECAKKSGDIFRAVKFFKMVNDQAELSECYLELGNYSDAAKSFIALENFDRALQLYPTILATNASLEGIDFTEPELHLISQALASGQADFSLVRILIKENRVVPLISQLARNGDIKAACDIYLQCPIDMGPELMAEKELTRQESTYLGEVFMGVSNYELAGKLFERIEEFHSAGEAFELAELYKRSSYCFERAGDHKKALEMRILLASEGTKEDKVFPVSSSHEDQDNPFSLDDVSRVRSSNSETKSAILPLPGIPAQLNTNDDSLGSIPEFRPPHDQNSSLDGQDKEEGLGNGFGVSESTNVLPPEQETASHLNVIQMTERFPILYETTFGSMLSQEQLHKLLGLGHLKEYAGNTTICGPDLDQKAIFIVLQGEVQVMAVGQQQPHMIIRPGASFGELTVLAGLAPNWSFANVGHIVVTVLCLPEAELLKLIKEDSEICRLLYKQLTVLLSQMAQSDDNPLKFLDLAS